MFSGCDVKKSRSKRGMLIVELAFDDGIGSELRVVTGICAVKYLLKNRNIGICLFKKGENFIKKLPFPNIESDKGNLHRSSYSASSSGRLVRVRSCDWASRQREISAWFPETST